MPGEGWQIPRIPTGLMHVGDRKKTPKQAQCLTPIFPKGTEERETRHLLSDIMKIIEMPFTEGMTGRGVVCHLP